MSQSIKRIIDNRAAVAAEANDRLNKYKRINADTKKKTKGIQIKPLQREDNTKFTKDGVNEVSELDPRHAPPDAPGRADFEHKFNSDSHEAMMASWQAANKRYDTDEAQANAPPDWSRKADFEHKFNSDSDEAMMASINDKRFDSNEAMMASINKLNWFESDEYRAMCQANAAGWASTDIDEVPIASDKATIASMADQSKAMIASMNHTMNHNTAMMIKITKSLKRDLDLLQLKHDAQTHRLAEVTSLCVQLKKAIPPKIKPLPDDVWEFIPCDDRMRRFLSLVEAGLVKRHWSKSNIWKALVHVKDQWVLPVTVNASQTEDATKSNPGPLTDTNGDPMPDDGKTYDLVVTKMKSRKIIKSCWKRHTHQNPVTGPAAQSNESSSEKSTAAQSNESRSKKSTMKSNRTSNNHSPADTGNIGKIVNCTSCGECRDPQSEDTCLKNIIDDQHCPVKSKYFDKFPVPDWSGASSWSSYTTKPSWGEPSSDEDSDDDKWYTDEDSDDDDWYTDGDLMPDEDSDDDDWYTDEESDDDDWYTDGDLMPDTPVVKVPRVYNDDKLRINVKRSVTDKMKRSNNIDKNIRSNDIGKNMKLKRSNDIGNLTVKRKIYVPLPSSDFHAAGAENALWSLTNSDFLNSNCSFDDPIENFSNGELQGSDGLPLRRHIVGDVEKERRIVDSVLRGVIPTPFVDLDIDNPSSSCVASLVHPKSSIVNDSGTEFSILTMETAKYWNGLALEEKMFQGIAGEPFSVFGGDDMILYIKNDMGNWILKNFGETYVSNQATLDLMSTHQMQLKKIGTTFDINESKSAFMFDDDGNKFPLKRSGGLWKFDIKFPTEYESDKALLMENKNTPSAYDSAGEHNPGSNKNTPSAYDSAGENTPGSFASVRKRCCESMIHGAGCCRSNPGDFKDAFKSSSSKCCGNQFVTSKPPEVKQNDTVNITLTQRKANMMRHHCTLNHCSMNTLNMLVRVGDITDGCIMLELNCDSCEVAGMIRSSKSHKRHARNHPKERFHTVHGDIYDAEDVDCRNGYKYVLGFTCVASGKVWTYNMKTKDESLDGFKEFEKYLDSIRPFVEEKSGCPMKLSVICFDREGSLTTTYGNMRSVADEYFHEQGYTRIFTSRSSSSVTSKIERFWRTLKKGVRVSMVESGLKDAFYFDAVHTFVQHYNCLPTDSNRIEPGIAPNTTLGLKFSIKRLRPFGAPGTLLKKPVETITASDIPGKFCIFIGYGLDTPGYRVIVPSIGEIKIYTDIDIKISRSIVPCRDFLTKCRVDPTYASIHALWYDRIFEVPSIGAPNGFLPGNPDIAFNKYFPTEVPDIDKVTVYPVQPNGTINMYVGQRVARKFGKDIFNGTITKFMPIVEDDDVDFWHVVYDDGDEEDWTKSDVDDGMMLFKKIKSNFDPRQTVGNTPQYQSRSSLKPHMSTKRSNTDVMTADEAKSIIRNGRRNDFDIKFIQDNPKKSGTKSYIRYNCYKRSTKFKDFDIRTKKFVAYLDSNQVLSSIKAADRDDLVNDLCKGYLTVIEKPVGANVVVQEADMGSKSKSKKIKIEDKDKIEDKMQFTVQQIIAPEIQKSVGARDSLNNTKIQKDLDTNMMNIDPPTDSKLENILMDLVNDIKNAVEIKKQHNPAPSYMVKNDDHMDKNTGMLDGFLERTDKENYNKSCASHLLRFNCIKGGVNQQDIELFDAAKHWWKNSSINTERKSSTPVEIPAWFALAAFQKAQVWVEGMAEPVSLVDAMKQPEWELQWKPAIEKEIMGLIMMGLWDEIPEDEVPKDTKIFPGHFVFKIKCQKGVFSKAKARYVFGGHRTSAGVDFFETAAYMAQMKTVRTVLSMAVADGHRLKNFDIRQAFTFSDALKPLYMYLPDLRKMGIDNPKCGKGKGSGYVARTKKMLYGQCDASRAWMNLLDEFMHSIGARPTICDRMAYTWKGCRIVVHVDDILTSCPTSELEDEFQQLLQNRFGEDNVTVDDSSWMLGIRIDYDMDKRTLKLSQGDFARKLLDTFDIPKDINPAKTPLPLNAEFRKFEGTASAHEIYNMMVLAGSLQWLQCCTRLDLSHATGMMARYASNPSPQHIEYGHHILRYIAGTLDKGITYHGSDAILNKGYPHRNKLYGSVDADLGGCKDTEKSTSGIVLMLNDGPVIWRSNRQTTTSTSTTESESKAACFIGQQCRWHKDLITELGCPQPPVRIMEDNQGQVYLSNGTNHGKSGHFRRAVGYYEGLVDQGILWFDKTPSNENGSDIFTKVVSPVEQFTRLANILMGETPEIFISRRVADIISNGHIR